MHLKQFNGLAARPSILDKLRARTMGWPHGQTRELDGTASAPVARTRRARQTCWDTA